MPQTCIHKLIHIGTSGACPGRTADCEFDFPAFQVQVDFGDRIGESSWDDSLHVDERKTCSSDHYRVAAWPHTDDTRHLDDPRDDRLVTTLITTRTQQRVYEPDVLWDLVLAPAIMIQKLKKRRPSDSNQRAAELSVKIPSSGYVPYRLDSATSRGAHSDAAPLAALPDLFSNQGDFRGSVIIDK